MNAPAIDLVGGTHRTARRAISSIDDPRDAEAFIGTSPAWREVIKRATRVAATEATTCPQGESGTGKEVVARYSSGRRSYAKDRSSIATNSHFGATERVPPLIGGNIGPLERQAIEQVIREVHGSKVKAAKQLGISRTQPYNRLRKYGL
jgi:DNA-binding NtrC family response regulator